MSHVFRCSGLSIFLLCCVPLAQAQPDSTEPALTWSVSGLDVNWGPCPEFMPAGCQLAVLHGDPSKPNADVVLRVPPKSSLPHHWHSSAERMVLISGELEVAYDGQPAATLKPGMYAYGPARLAHSATCQSTEPCALFIAFEGPVDAVPTANGQP
jgi:quercetin dioxygenase-like cupin family protein